MASDVLLDDYLDDELDLNSDIFMTSGIMNPKELYLTDISDCKDTEATELTQYKGASSSDSGISTLDDLHDVANVTDLNSILDTDFKELDFTLDFVVSKTDHDDCSDTDMLVKQEPPSPPLYRELQVSPDFFFHGEVAVKDERSSLILPTCQQFDPLSPASSTYSPPQKYPVEALCEPPSPTQIHSPSPEPFLTTHSFQTSQACTSFPAFPYTKQHVSILQHVNSLTDMPGGTNSAGSPHHVSPMPASPPNFLVLPCIKKDSQVSILSPSGGSLASCGDAKPPLTAASFNIDAILNSKVKIQPKPGLETVITTGTSQWGPNTTSSHLSFSSQQTFPIITSSAISSSGTSIIADEKSLKRAQRIIKNRESASLSRKRKKEYMNSLEEWLQQCREENERLLKENDTLRRQVEFLQKQNSGLKQLTMSPAKKICLMCMAFLLALNLTPFGFLNMLDSTSSRQKMGPTYHPTGRHLMSLPEDGRLSEYGSSVQISKDVWARGLLMGFDEDLNLLAKKLNITERLGNICPMYFNSTESNRLAEQLRGWMISQEEEKKKKEKKQQKKKKSYSPLRHFSAGPSGVHPHAIPNKEVNGQTMNGHNYPVQVFSGSHYSRQKLLNAIPRRNDTFYVLSFSTDYFLVPATAHNKTMRPRMSLLMPVLTPSINESTGHAHDSIGVMQIDCEILNTNLIHLYHPSFTADAMNYSSPYESHGNSSNNTEESMHPDKERSNGTNRNHNQNLKYWEKLRKSTSD